MRNVFSLYAAADESAKNANKWKAKEMEMEIKAGNFLPQVAQGLND